MTTQSFFKRLADDVWCVYKNAEALLDYSVWWSDPKDDWLQGDTITTSSWTVDDAGLTLQSGAQANGLATIWLAGGTVGTTYTVTNHIVTAGGRHEKRSFLVIVQ